MSSQAGVPERPETSRTVTSTKAAAKLLMVIATSMAFPVSTGLTTSCKIDGLREIEEPLEDQRKSAGHDRLLSIYTCSR